MPWWVHSNRGLNGIVTVSGQSIEDTGTGLTMLHINTDGTIDQTEATTRTQIDSATDWIIPNQAANGIYQVKWVALSGDVMNAGNMLGTEDTWLDIDTERTIGLETGVPILEDGAITVSIRKGTGAVLDSATFSFQALDSS